MRFQLLPIFALAALFGCTKAIDPYPGAPTDHPGGFGVVGPTGWTAVIDGNAVVFTPPAGDVASDGATIRIAMLPPSAPDPLPPDSPVIRLGAWDLRVPPAAKAGTMDDGKPFVGRFRAYGRAFEVECRGAAARGDPSPCLRTVRGFR